MKDTEIEDTAYLHEAVHGTYSEMHNNANWRSIAISLKRIADGLEHSSSGGIPHILDAMLDAMNEISAALDPEERK
jgi:hypothetical protein